MSTTARKARKRAGQQFVRTPKVGTPLTERASFEFMQIPKAAIELAIRGGSVASVTSDLEDLRAAQAVRRLRRKALGR